MKRIFTVVLITILLAGIPVYTYAGALEKAVNVEISASAECVRLGETVVLTAVAEKHGSSYADMWEGAVKKDTVFGADTEAYVSTAEFTADRPGIYTIIYSISMNAGQSETAFSGTATCMVEVVNPVTVTGADIRNLSISRITRSDGSTYGYSAMGDVYVLWSDGTAAPYSTIGFFFGAEETSKIIPVTLNIAGKTYRYTVAVTRE